MAKKPAKVGGTLETTIIFPKKTVLQELAEAKRQHKKRSQSLAGTYGQKIADAVERDHLDRKAFGIAMQLDGMDDERLHLTFHNLLKYCDDLGITKRATAQEEMFKDGDGAEPSGKFSDKKSDDENGGTVTPFRGGAGRAVDAAE